MGKIETRPLFTQLRKVNSKQMKDLNIRPETIKLLEEMIGSNLFDTGLDNILDKTLKMQSTKAKINKWETRELLHRKGNNQKIKKATYRMRENICKPYI